MDTYLAVAKNLHSQPTEWQVWWDEEFSFCSQILSHVQTVDFVKESTVLFGEAPGLSVAFQPDLIRKMKTRALYCYWKISLCYGNFLEV